MYTRYSFTHAYQCIQDTHVHRIYQCIQDTHVHRIYQCIQDTHVHRIYQCIQDAHVHRRRIYRGHSNANFWTHFPKELFSGWNTLQTRKKVSGIGGNSFGSQSKHFSID